LLTLTFISLKYQKARQTMAIREDDDRVSFLGRVPPDVKAWLIEQGRFHCCPQNAVLVKALRAAMDAARREARAAAVS
jgi:hypothetical protein